MYFFTVVALKQEGARMTICSAVLNMTKLKERVITIRGNDRGQTKHRK